MRFVSAESLQIIKQFRLRSIFFKYLKITTSLILIPFLLINFVTYFTYADISNKKIVDLLKQSTFYAQSSISDIFNDVDDTYINVSNNYAITNFFNEPNNSDYALRVTPALTTNLGKADGIDSISLYNFSVPYVFSTKDGGDLSNFADATWLKQYKETKTSNSITRTVIYDYSTHLPENTLTFCYGLYRNSICVGLIVINYKFSAIESKLASSKNRFILADKNNVILYADDSALLGTDLNDIVNCSEASNDIHNLTVEKNHSHLTTTYLFTEKKIKLAVVSDTEMYAEQMRNLKWIVLAIFLAACVIPIVVAFYVSMKFYKTIIDILHTFGSIENNSDSARSDDEIKLIIENLQGLLSKNESIENELVKNLAVLKKSQITALQLQFNHHFLFNTLNLISMSARTELPRENITGNAIALLSDLLRISLDTEQYFVPISTEISYAKMYIDIELLKLKNMFKVVWDVDESLYQHKIIKLVFQPIIENAFRHGLRTMPASMDKVLTIRGFSSGDNIEFHFIDNGKGIPPEKLKELNEMLASNAIPSTKHIGLANVNTRIKLIFGDNCGVSIKSDSCGTDVSIVIPKVG